MSQLSHQGNVMIPAVLLLGSAVAIIALLVWLAGLIIVLHGTTPRDRSAILRAYAICRPPVPSAKRMHPWRHCPTGNGQDSALENPPKAHLRVQAAPERYTGCELPGPR